ncbi:MAG: histidinol phosphatase [Paenibacillus sp.]|nr:histidinol phosphatase [Paenibacillus sp.]
MLEASKEKYSILRWDGHSHTKFCKHGHPDELHSYLDRAIELGFTRYSITEHPPLPHEYIDDLVLMRELAMDQSEVPDYIRYVSEYKKLYEGRLDVRLGLELDYLDGHASFTDQIVAPWLNVLEDLIVSVHYLPGKGGMRCIDYKPSDFETNILSYYGTMERVVDEYFDHVERAIAYAAALPGTKRIGHINLIKKFRNALPPIDEAQINARLEAILPQLISTGVGLDINTAGLRVATCGEAYVPDWYLRKALQAGVACVYGSDSHKPEHVGFGLDWLEQVRFDRTRDQ